MAGRAPPQPPVQRDIMFCHQCENEWYRDEHGLACPECQSEFCEVIEAHNDPRDDNPASPNEQQLPWNAPDPDEDDIDQFTWQPTSPGDLPGIRSGGVGPQAPGQQAAGGGITGLIGSAIQGFIGNIMQPPDYNTTQQRHRDSDDHSFDDDVESQDTERRTVSPNGTTVTRHVHGNGYSFTMTTSSSSNLHPRNANGAQPFQRHPETIDELMMQMLSNIGAVGPGMPQRNGFPPTQHPFAQAGAPTSLFQLLGMPLGGIIGDAVYSQEGLDRIISQLMEQHQTGNAPGPASDAAIRSLPEREITKEDFGDEGTAECSICMEAVELGTKVTVLPCQHWFHADCVGAWLGEHDTCPHCRKGIMPAADADATSPRTPQQPPLHDMHDASRVPGSYPFPSQGSRGGSSSRPSGQSAGVFDRMREAFGGGSPHDNDHTS